MSKFEMNETEQAIFASVPQVPEGVEFKLVGVRKIGVPHPFTITPKHVAWASDHGGVLGLEACRQAPCGWESRDGMGHKEYCHLSYDEHEQQMSLYIAVPRARQRDLNTCPGLVDYLLSVKEIELGLDGFAFPALEEE
jgi:hypothetical protein